MQLTPIRSLGRILVFGLALTAAACADDPLSPEERVAGEYTATTLTVNQGGATFDALQTGARLDIILRENGTTTGRLFVPQGDEDGGDFEADLTGTFTVSEDGQRVTFDQAADTFIRDVEFTVQGNQLVSNALGVQVVLTRQ